MGDLTRGETFADGETVTAARLHKLVEDATIKAGVIVGSMIADGTITAAKLDGGNSSLVSAIQLPENNVIVGGASNTGTAVAMDTGTMTAATTFGVKDAGIVTAKLADLAVTTAKLAAGAVTGAKLETLSPSPAGTYGSATLVPVIVVDANGRVTGVTTASLTGSTVTKYMPDLQAIPEENGDYWQFPHDSVGKPNMVNLWFECVSDTDGYTVGDRIPIWSVFCGGVGYDWPVFTFSYDSEQIRVIRHMMSGNSFYYDAESTNDVVFPTDKWRIRAICWT